ncbi:MAG: cation transporter [Alphaproteobacteria bacterium]|nr:cation transporter [Alphaproteobacteria bacterium]
MSEHCHHHHHHHHHHHTEVTAKSVKLLIVSFAINMFLSIAEIIGGIISGSVALIGDALHNTSDALSILIAVIAFKIGSKKASAKYTYGFKRAEVIGGFVNLILLFISGCYLMVEGIGRLIQPEQIEGMIIIWISVLALVVDIFTAKISHHGAHHNTNMKMVFIHNLADAFGSIGVIISGLCIVWFGVYSVDGIVALLIAFYMIFQSIVTFPKIVNILMNAAPDNIDIEQVKKSILEFDDVKDVHHLHLWNISEHNIALECHVESCNSDVVAEISDKLKNKFGIDHCNIQVEKISCGKCCDL